MSSFDEREKSFEKNLHMMKNYNLKLVPVEINILAMGFTNFRL